LREMWLLVTSHSLSPEGIISLLLPFLAAPSFRYAFYFLANVYVVLTGNARYPSIDVPLQINSCTKYAWPKLVSLTKTGAGLLSPLPTLVSSKWDVSREVTSV
jgi:hypothetical protein